MISFGPEPMAVDSCGRSMLLHAIASGFGLNEESLL